MSHNPGRRQLLRGSLAAPAVLTVASPSAFAASSLNACIARGAANQPNPLPPAFVDPSLGPCDLWYRVEVPFYDAKLSTGGWLEFFQAPSGFYYLSDGSSSTPYSSIQFKQIGAEKFKKWALVYLDQEGVGKGIGPYPEGGYVVSRSCWTSFSGQPTCTAR